VIIEYITVWHSRFKEWISLMPWSLIQYLAIVLIFYYFIFRRKWSDKRIFMLMIILMYILEFIWQNFLLLNIYLFIPGSLLLISIWGFLTFIPLWTIDGTLREHKLAAIFYSLWILVAIIMGVLAYLPK
jgi:hypothetical protein